MSDTDGVVSDLSLQRCGCGWWDEFGVDDAPCPECGASGRAEVTTVSDETMGRVRVVVDVAHLTSGPPMIYVRVLDSVVDIHLRVDRVRATSPHPTKSELGRVAHLVHTGLATLLSKEITRRTPAVDAALALRPLVASLSRVHPTPWRVEDDWTGEVIDSSGGTVVKLSSRRTADLVVAVCGELESLTAASASCDDAP